MKFEGVYLGFDFGTKHIGIASGQTITKTASPLTTLTAQNGVPSWEKLEALLQQWQPKGLIVGLALQPDGSHSDTSKATLKFANALKKRFNLPVFLIEERLTSVAAHSILKSKPKSHYKHANKDSLAAAIILESWLNDPKEALSHV